MKLRTIQTITVKVPSIFNRIRRLSKTSRYEKLSLFGFLYFKQYTRLLEIILLFLLADHLYIVAVSLYLYSDKSEFRFLFDITEKDCVKFFFIKRSLVKN
jgi:hypothetical protein